MRKSVVRMVNKKYDLIIIGGGAAAFAAANTANKLKKRTLMINDKTILPMGGTCVNVGCVPSKVMLHQGETIFYPPRTEFSALKVSGKGDFVKALKETREMAAGFQYSNYGKVIESQKFVEFKEGRGGFKDENTIVVDGEEFKGEKILIATGASTIIPKIKGIDEVDYLTNKSVFFDLKEKPKSITIFGGGASAIEFSQIFAHFGIKVVVIQRSEKILTKQEPEISKALQKYLEEEGIIIHTGTNIKEVKNKGKLVSVIFDKNGEEIIVDSEKLFMAQGLKPHTENIGVENSGIELNKRGFVKVNEFLQTNKPHIYAIGDVNGLMPLETVAAKQGAAAANNMFGEEKKMLNYDEIPSAVFTYPQVASVGITEEEYMKKYNTCLCKTVDWNHVEKAAAIKETKGMLKMVIDPKTKVVLGVHILGPMAADIITTATYAIKNKMTIYDIRDTVHVFPTLSEIIKKAAQSFEQNLDEMSCCVE